ncbi:MAG: hypothetical protein ACI9R3_002294 [Verrucomicrobiales bacterium]|jgi:hypothetical protein
MDTDSALGGEPVRQFSVFLHNRAGTLLGLVRLLNDADVQVIALSVQDSVDVTVVRMLVTDPDTVDTLFMERGIPFGGCEVVVVELENGANDLSKCLSNLLTAETNIHFVYSLLSRPDGKAALALHLEDIDFGMSVLRSNGFRVLSQSDITR